jgi:hypothetical protein
MIEPNDDCVTKPLEKGCTPEIIGYDKALEFDALTIQCRRFGIKLAKGHRDRLGRLLR